jgi:hypothetical protein
MQLSGRFGRNDVLQTYGPPQPVAGIAITLHTALYIAVLYNENAAEFKFIDPANTTSKKIKRELVSLR